MEKLYQAIVTALRELANIPESDMSPELSEASTRLTESALWVRFAMDCQKSKDFKPTVEIKQKGIFYEKETERN